MDSRQHILACLGALVVGVFLLVVVVLPLEQTVLPDTPWFQLAILVVVFGVGVVFWTRSNKPVDRLLPRPVNPGPPKCSRCGADLRWNPSASSCHLCGELTENGKREPPMCSECGHDLLSNLTAKVCPKCGRPLTRENLSRLRLAQAQSSPESDDPTQTQG